MPTEPLTDASLETELSYFNAKRSELVRQAEGKFALIKGERLVGIFDDQLDAIRHGYQILGNEAFLVKQIVPVEIPLNFTSFNLGV